MVVADNIDLSTKVLSVPRFQDVVTNTYQWKYKSLLVSFLYAVVWMWSEFLTFFS